MNGRVPVPLAYSAVATRAGTTVQGAFAFDATRRMLTYNVKVSGTSPAGVHAIALARDSAGVPGPIIRRLAAQGIANARGEFLLGEADRPSLRAGRLRLTLVSAGQPELTAYLTQSTISPAR